MGEDNQYLELFIKTSIDKLDRLETEVRSLGSAKLEQEGRIKGILQELNFLRETTKELSKWKTQHGPTVERVGEEREDLRKRRRDLTASIFEKVVMVSLGAAALALYDRYVKGR